MSRAFVQFLLEVVCYVVVAGGVDLPVIMGLLCRVKSIAGDGMGVAW